MADETTPQEGNVLHVSFDDLFEIASAARETLLIKSRGGDPPSQPLAEFARRLDPFTVTYILQEFAKLHLFKQQVLEWVKASGNEDLIASAMQDAPAKPKLVTLN